MSDVPKFVETCHEKDSDFDEFLIYNSEHPVKAENWYNVSLRCVHFAPEFTKNCKWTFEEGKLIQFEKSSDECLCDSFVPKKLFMMERIQEMIRKSEKKQNEQEVLEKVVKMTRDFTELPNARIIWHSLRLALRMRNVVRAFFNKMA